MNAGRESFEVQILRQNRWVTESMRPKDAEARELAKKIFADKSCAGVRVVRNWMKSDGSMVESTVFEEKRTVRDDGPIRINPIEERPPLCDRPRDYFGLESRGIINRVLRNYLEKALLTPTELLHNNKELRRLRDKDALVPSAVDHIATLQTKGTDINARERREAIFTALDQIQAQARRAEGMKLPAIRGRFSQLVATCGRVGGEAPEYLAMVVLAKELIGLRSWIGKLDRLCQLAAEDDDGQAVLLLDTVIADVLGANVVQELLGWQSSLGSAIIAMLDLADGKFDSTKSDAKDVADRLNILFAEGKLPGSRHVLIDRALRQLRSPNPLARNDPNKEMEEYRRVLERLLVPGGLLSGPAAAEALTTRGSRMVEQGGATGRRAAITNTVRALPDRAHGVMYLAELSKTEMAKDHLPDIIQQLDFVFGARVIGELTRRSLSPKERMESATHAHRAAIGSALPDEVKQRVADHIDGVLERYLLDEKIIEKLDDPSAHLRDRAVRLVKFCSAGVMPEGKAMARARKRIIEMLRQPGFDRAFIDGISDPARAEKALRDFYKLLVKAGIA